MPIFDKFYNGIGKARFDQAGFDTLQACDIHSEIGSLTCSSSLVKESGTTVDELCKIVVVLTNGDSLWFGSTTGKIWKRTAAGVWSLVHTVTAGPVLGAAVFNGYVYYAVAATLGRQTEVLASSEATWSSNNDAWAAFDNDDTNFHPMAIQNLSLFIGDGYKLAAVDNAGIFQANSLDLEIGHHITTLFPYENDLLVCSVRSSSVNKSFVFRWDTYSSSWSVSDDVDEYGINMFIQLGSVVWAQIGTIGNLYLYSGAKFDEPYGTIRDGGTTIVTTGVLPYGTSNINGLPLVNTSRGIYSLGRRNRDMPVALNIEYLPSVGAGVTPGAVLVIGSTILMAWKLSTAYGVDVISTAKATATIVCPLALGKLNDVVVYYDSMPAGTSISIYTKADGGSYVQQTAVQDSQDINIVHFNGGIGNHQNVQPKILLNPYGTTAPVITRIEVI